MKKLLLIISITFFFSNSSHSQSYLGNKSKYRFAQGAMGIDLQYIPANGSSNTITNNLSKGFNYGGYYVPKIVIGGLHFWGHADIAFNFPIGEIAKKKDTIATSFGDQDIMTFKYYPWAIQNHKVRPYIGTAFNLNTFRQQGTEAYKTTYGGQDYRFSLPFNAGLSYQVGSILFNLDAKFNLSTERTIYANRTQTTTMNLPNYSVSFGIRKLFESTVPQFEKRFEDGSMKKEYDELKGKLNAFSFGIGMSSAIYTETGEYNQTNRKFISKNPTDFFPEIGIGYYLDKPDLHFNLAYRKSTSKEAGFGIEQLFKREALTFEAFKFLWDYKGWLPFAGLGISKDNLSFSETDFGKTTLTASGDKITPSIIFGWDIRYHRNYWIMFRTNMRYYPFLDIDSPKGKIKFNQLELNFIQAVIYPQRLINRKKN
jgi:hypothetical protein